MHQKACARIVARQVKKDVPKNWCTDTGLSSVAFWVLMLMAATGAIYYYHYHYHYHYHYQYHYYY